MRAKYIIEDCGIWWRIKASNGKILATSEQYKNRSAMLRVMKKLCDTLNWGTKYTERAVIRKGE